MLEHIYGRRTGGYIGTAVSHTILVLPAAQRSTKVSLWSTGKKIFYVLHVTLHLYRCNWLQLKGHSDETECLIYISDINYILTCTQVVENKTRSSCVGVLVCMKDDLSSFPTCIFCVAIMPLFSIHKDSSGYPTWLLDEERHLQNSTQLKSLILQMEFLYTFFSSLKKRQLVVYNVYMDSTSWILFLSVACYFNVTYNKHCAKNFWLECPVLSSNSHCKKEALSSWMNLLRWWYQERFYFLWVFSKG